MPYRTVVGQESPRDRSQVLRLLIGLILIRFLFHALYVPMFEGPDEPGHLGRAVTEFRQDQKELPAGIVAQLGERPCGPDLQRAFGCPPFQGSGAFNILVAASPDPGNVGKAENYEQHQPPLYYWLSAPFVWFSSSSVRLQLLILRLLSVAMVGIALLGPLRSLLEGERDVAETLLLLLLLPGAAESLARASNDALVFLWAATTWWVSSRRSGSAVLPILLAAGPLIKLTAFPVVVASVVLLWLKGRRTVALIGAVSSLAVVPVQFARGWGWGGTYELNRSLGSLDASFTEIGVGLGRSSYTFIKTIFWLGGWSFFRAPLWLVILWAVFLSVWLVAAVPRQGLRAVLPHLAGAGTALAGFLLLAVQNRRLFGDWGGLGGWYFWGWYPWIASAISQALRIRAAFRRHLLGATAVFVVLANLFWFRSALSLYGCRP